MNGFDYILRFAVEPGFHEDERLDTLIEFCQAGKISEVMFLVGAEELNSGHLTAEEIERWLVVAAKGRERLKEIGVAVSLNPWTTMLHCDRGRTLKDGQNFRRMVDVEGSTASAVACPIDESFVSYLCSSYAQYAAFGPKVLWVEDDFRLHNHSPLVWGGCFCDEHMKLYSSLAGKELTREEFIEGICSAGKVHPYRKIWLDTARETINMLSKRLGQAVFSVDPDIRIGLMTSYPAIHCSEARDWDTVLNNFTGNKRPWVRIHLPAYPERTPQDYGISFHYASRNTKAFLPPDVETYPELENFTDTRYIKSLSFTAFQIENTIALGSHGITLNLYDMTGNGVLLNEGYQTALSGSKPFLDAAKALALRVENQTGVHVMVDADASYHLHSYDSKTLFGICPRENLFSSLLSLFSVANCFCTDKSITGRTIAVSGQYFRNLSKEETVHLLTNNRAILDGEAVMTLKDLGLLHLIGAQNAKVIAAMTGYQSYEQVCNGRRYCGIHEARMGAQEYTGDLVAIDYSSGADAEIITTEHRYDGECVGAGIAIVDRRILILPYIDYPQDFGSHKNTVLAEIVQEFIRSHSDVPYIESCPHLYVFHYLQNGKNAFIVSNHSGDSYDGFTMNLKRKTGPMRILSKDCVPARMANVESAEGRVVFKEKIDRLGVAVIYEE